MHGRAAVALLAISRVAAGSRETLSVERKGAGGGRFIVEVARDADGSGARATIDGEPLEIDAEPLAGSAWSLILAGCQHEASIVEKRPGRFDVRVRDELHVLQIESIA